MTAASSKHQQRDTTMKKAVNGSTSYASSSSTNKSSSSNMKSGTSLVVSPRHNSQQQKSSTTASSLLQKNGSRRNITTSTTDVKSSSGSISKSTVPIAPSAHSTDSSTSLSIIRQWLTELDLEQSVDVILNAMISVGVTTPETLITLQPQHHFDSLYITSSNDKRKVFFLIQRIKHLIAEQQQNDIEVETHESKLPTTNKSPTSTTSSRNVSSTSQRSMSMSKQSSSKSISSNNSSHNNIPSLKENCRPSTSSSTTTSKEAQQERKLVKSASDLLLDDVLNNSSRGDATTTSRATAKSASSTSTSQLQPPTSRTPRASSSGRSTYQRNNFASSATTASGDSTGGGGGGISLRTGKQLSTIPSEQVPPMSPLVDYDLIVESKSNVHSKLNKQSRNHLSTNNNRRRSHSHDNSSVHYHDDDEEEEDHNSVMSNASKGSSVSSNRRRITITAASAKVGSSYNNTTSNNRRITLASKLEKQNSSSALLLASSNASVVSSQTMPAATTNSSTFRRSQSAKMIFNDGNSANKNDINGPQQQTGFMINTMNNSSSNNSFKAQIDYLRDQTNSEHELFAATNNAVPTDDDEMRIRVIVRKRPMTTSSESSSGGDIDIIHPLVYDTYGRILVYQPKTRVDLTKQIDTIPFAFDNVYNESSTNQHIYLTSIRSLIPSFFMGQWSSIFAYGQTGSGKTFTMMGNNFTGMTSSVPINDDVSNLGLYYMAALDIFHALQKPEYASTYSIRVSLFEIYAGKLFDLLNGRAAVKCLEDSKGNVCFPGLSEHPVTNANALMKLIVEGATLRSCGTTSRNADSSRSHAVLQLHLYRKVTIQTTKRRTGGVTSSSNRNSNEEEFSRLTFIDLAGSERGADTSNASRATRLEGAEINTSLLALKEVIRALATGDSLTHVPFRGSKLTQVLKQSFVGKNCRSVMIACISPNIGNCEQTLNTLRYADRVKERQPETGELTLNALSSTRSITPTRKQQQGSYQSNSVASSNNNQSMLSQKSDLLDELLASPPTSNDEKDCDAFDDGDVEEEEYDLVDATKETVESARKDQSLSSDVLGELISTHVDATEVMMEMVREEMAMINTTDTSANQFDEYLARVYALQEEQLSMITMLRELLSQYRSMDGTTATSRNGASYTDHLNVLDTEDDTFEDLRD